MYPWLPTVHGWAFFLQPHAVVSDKLGTAHPHVSLCCRTYTWIDDQEARPNVSYVLASGSTVAFGALLSQQEQTVGHVCMHPHLIPHPT